MQIQHEPRHSMTRESILIGIVLFLGMLAALILLLPALVSS